MKNILTLGSGFVADHLKYPQIKDRINIYNSNIDEVLDKYKPDVLINCLGKTGRPNVDECEVKKEETALANTVLPILLAEKCIKKSIKLIHIGSGCVYFNPLDDFEYEEKDFANPESYYSKTKYACDLILGDLPVLTLRIRMPISTKNHERNLINKLRSYKKIIDIPNSVTFMDDLVRCIDWAAEKDLTGIYHVTNPDPLTAVQIMKEYQKYFPEHKFEVMSRDELNSVTKATRSNCILDTKKLNSEGFWMEETQVALENCMKEYVKNI